jgi:hypothetical protein
MHEITRSEVNEGESLRNTSEWRERLTLKRGREETCTPRPRRKKSRRRRRRRGRQRSR